MQFVFHVWSDVSYSLPLRDVLPGFINSFTTQKGTATNLQTHAICRFTRKEKERLLTSRPLVPLEGLEADVGPSLGMAAGVSLVTASLSNLTDKNKIQNKM